MKVVLALVATILLGSAAQADTLFCELVVNGQSVDSQYSYQGKQMTLAGEGVTCVAGLQENQNVVEISNQGGAVTVSNVGATKAELSDVTFCECSNM